LALLAAVAVALLALFTVQAVVVLRPRAKLVRRLHPWAYGGFYVDDLVSRWLLARWPVPAAPAASSASPSLAGAAP
jgi:NAD(P)H-quinone oxidoreductase subunit 5